MIMSMFSATERSKSVKALNNVLLFDLNSGRISLCACSCFGSADHFVCKGVV